MKYKVVHLVAGDELGGAVRAALSSHYELKKAEINSKISMQFGKSNSSDVEVVDKTMFDNAMRRFRYIKNQIPFRSYPRRKKYIFSPGIFGMNLSDHHLVKPKEELSKMLQLSDTIVFSTDLLPSEIPNPKNWWYYAFGHGQHISFYSLKTLNFLAKKFALNLYTSADLFIMTKKNLNTTKLKLITKMYRYGLFIYVKYRMTSKIWSDHLLLKKREGLQ